MCVCAVEGCPLNGVPLKTVQVRQTKVIAHFKLTAVVSPAQATNTKAFKTVAC